MPTLMVVWPGTVSMSVRLRSRQLDLQLVQPMDEVAGEVDGADAEMGHRGMGLDAGEGGDDAAAGILGVDHAHHGGLAHDHRLRPRHGADQALGQRMGAQAADLLVVAEGEMHRHLQPGALEGRHVGEAGGDEALHVAGAAAVEIAVGLLGELPRIGRSRPGRRPARRRYGPTARCRPRGRDRSRRTGWPWCLPRWAPGCSSRRGRRDSPGCSGSARGWSCARWCRRPRGASACRSNRRRGYSCAAPSHGSCHGAKSLISLAKLSSRLTRARRGR